MRVSSSPPFLPGPHAGSGRDVDARLWRERGRHLVEIAHHLEQQPEHTYGLDHVHFQGLHGLVIEHAGGTRRTDAV